jgi:putative PIN family toxin of toxin-antitoxin system
VLAPGLLYIAGNMNYVLDTNVLVAGIRSPRGASAEILRQVLQGQVPVVCSVPLFLEYEDVLLRPQQLAAAGLEAQDVVNFLDVLAGVVQRVSIQFLWRPQLRDPNDDFVLEVAVNAQGLGPAVRILTFNQRDFLPQALQFGVGICMPQQFFQGA